MLALLKVCTACASALICLNYVAPNDISPPQPVLADLFELDTTAVHALVSFHSPPTQQFCSLISKSYVFPGEQDDHHGGADGLPGPAESVHRDAPLGA